MNNSFNEKHTDYFYAAIDCYNLLTKSVAESSALDKSLTLILSTVNDFKGIFGTYNFNKGDYNVNSKLNIVQFDGLNFNEYVIPNQSVQY